MDLKRVIINQIIILSLQVILYFGCEYFQKKPKNIATEFDKKIPVLPLFTLIYTLVSAYSNLSYKSFSYFTGLL